MTETTNDKGVHVIDFSKTSASPLNPLNTKLRLFILEHIHEANNDPHTTSILLYGGGPHFSAGADLTEFAHAHKLLSSSNNRNNKIPSLIDVVDTIEASPKPVTAFITGTCLGGGLELALASHHRICSHTARMGLPEVHVGVIPGAGGTQRLPRLIGLQSALHMILTGAPVNAARAQQLGLVDDVIAKQSDNFLDFAIRYSGWTTHLPIVRVSTRSVPESIPVAHAMCHTARLSLPQHGSEGLHNALEACSYAVRDFECGMAQESKLFLKTLTSEEGRAKRHAFFAQRVAQKQIASTNKHRGSLEGFPENAVCGVIGAGTMGGGIALVLLQAGYNVIVVDIQQAALEKGKQTIQKTIQSQVKRKKLQANAANGILQNLSFSQSLEDLKDCDLVVEAVVENMKVKQSIFRQLDQITKTSCLLLSNTSTLSIDAIVSVVSPARQSLTAGWHFFSPAHVMKLVEIVVGQETSTEMVVLLQTLTKKIRKIGVVVGNCDGFCGNRMLRPYSAETVLCLTEHNNSVEEVDRALLNFGMALGPLQMADLAGTDIGFNIGKARGWVREPGGPVPKNRPARYTELADDMVSQLGRLGQKVGKGWYDYNAAVQKGRKGLHSKEMEDFVKYYVTGTEKLTENEIVEKVLYPLVNEGFKCLEEDIARCPSDIDIVYLYGYGWPVSKGGPMYWADHIVGLPKLLTRLEDFHRKYPDTDHYVPSQLLKQCVKSGLTVEKYYKSHYNSQTSKL